MYSKRHLPDTEQWSQSSGPNVVPRRARPGLAGLRPLTSLPKQSTAPECGKRLNLELDDSSMGGAFSDERVTPVHGDCAEGGLANMRRSLTSFEPLGAIALDGGQFGGCFQRSTSPARKRPPP
jgi:hypothetical protein